MLRRAVIRARVGLLQMCGPQWMQAQAVRQVIVRAIVGRQMQRGQQQRACDIEEKRTHPEHRAIRRGTGVVGRVHALPRNTTGKHRWFPGLPWRLCGPDGVTPPGQPGRVCCLVGV